MDLVTKSSKIFKIFNCTFWDDETDFKISDLDLHPHSWENAFGSIYIMYLVYDNVWSFTARVK
jgi:hypothetical protein